VGRLGLGLGLVLRLGLGLQLRIGIGFRRNHSWSSTFTPRRNHSLCLINLELLFLFTALCTTWSIVLPQQVIHLSICL